NTVSACWPQLSSLPCRKPDSCTLPASATRAANSNPATKPTTPPAPKPPGPPPDRLQSQSGERMQPTACPEPVEGAKAVGIDAAGEQAPEGRQKTTNRTRATPDACRLSSRHAVLV